MGQSDQVPCNEKLDNRVFAVTDPERALFVGNICQSTEPLLVYQHRVMSDLGPDDTADTIVAMRILSDRRPLLGLPSARRATSSGG